MSKSTVRETYRGVESLPVETLSRALRYLFVNACFANIQSVLVRYSVMQVCRFWCAALCGDPSCWSQFYVSLQMPVDVLEEWLRRVGQTSFALTMDFNYDRGQHFGDAFLRLEELFDPLRGHFKRCYALSVRAGGGKLCDRLFSLLLPVPFPSMTHLDLDVKFAFELSFFDFARAKGFTKLTYLSFHRTFPSGDWTPFLVGITTVKLAAIDDFSRPTLADFHSFLSAMPDLEFLILHDLDCLFPPQFYKDDTPLIPRTQPMPSLTRLEVSSDNPMHTWLLASLDAPALSHFTLHTASETMLSLLPGRCGGLLNSVTSFILWSGVTKLSVLGDLLGSMPSLQDLDGRYARFSFSTVFYMLTMQREQFCPQLKRVVLSQIGPALVDDLLLSRPGTNFSRDFQVLCVTASNDRYRAFCVVPFDVSDAKVVRGKELDYIDFLDDL
ncbi:hypothetical protein R3P38DRAFT_3180555 [Favolaschia claudopus]|uniref:F-box domain-containing protein n=1 Tax=Favolaschia claudopus TaxID=2862362 RepID=A0AAW0CRR1_9AGAR